MLIKRAAIDRTSRRRAVVFRAIISARRPDVTVDAGNKCISRMRARDRAQVLPKKSESENDREPAVSRMRDRPMARVCRGSRGEIRGTANCLGGQFCGTA